MKFGISERIFDRMVNLIKEEQSVEKLTIFGSRARGDYEYNSDIDFAVYGKNIPKTLSMLIRNSSGIYKVDVVFIEDLGNELLLKNIKEEEVVIFDRR